jgi:hypothetical protein
MGHSADMQNRFAIALIEFSQWQRIFHTKAENVFKFNQMNARAGLRRGLKYAPDRGEDHVTNQRVPDPKQGQAADLASCDFEDEPP